MMGHLNSFSASGVGNLNKNLRKIQMPGGLPGGGGMFNLRFDWYITPWIVLRHSVQLLLQITLIKKYI